MLGKRFSPGACGGFKGAAAAPESSHNVALKESDHEKNL
jgi:hypothetical protein